MTPSAVVLEMAVVVGANGRGFGMPSLARPELGGAATTWSRNVRGWAYPMLNAMHDAIVLTDVTHAMRSLFMAPGHRLFAVVA